MRFYEKVLVLLVAFCVSVLGFNLIASSSVCLLTTARDAGYEPIKNYSARCNANLSTIEFIANTEKQLQSPSAYLQFAHAKQSLPEEISSKTSRKAQD
ncbi:MAG: hypothetical protein PVI66_08010 [Candidatus Aminicenantes bacterium]|jgi:hypothetical protein